MDKNIAAKLTQLSAIQAVDTRLDEIVKMRGTLPEEVDVLREYIEKLCIKIVDTENVTRRYRG